MVYAEIGGKPRGKEEKKRKTEFLKPRRELREFEATKFEFEQGLIKGKNLCSFFVEIKLEFTEIKCGNLKEIWLVLLGNSVRIIKRKEA